MIEPKPPGSKAAPDAPSLRQRISSLSKSEEVLRTFPTNATKDSSLSVEEGGDSEEDEEDSVEGSVTDSESSVGEQELEESDPEEAGPIRNVEGIGSARLHPMHFSSKGGRKTVTLTKCFTARDLAKAGAAAYQPGDEDNDVRFTISSGKLIAAGSTFSMECTLLFSEVASYYARPSSAASGEGGATDGISVISIVEAMTAEELATVKAATAGQDGFKNCTLRANFVSRGLKKDVKFPEVSGCLLVCPTRAVGNILGALSAAGAVRIELERFYNLDLGGKTGTGSFGAVVRAVEYCAVRATSWAVKMIKPTVKEETVKQEIEMLVAAQGHESVIGFRSVFFDNTKEAPSWALVFDYYSKGDMYDLVAAGKPMTEREVLPYMHDLLSALAHLGNRGIFHRDVKPENLLISNTGRAILTDFGIACYITNKTEMQKKSGTIGYASPEMLLGEATGCHGDAFGAGIVLFFMVSKSTPFLAPTPVLITRRTIDCKLTLDYDCFDRLSQPCRDLLSRFIVKSIEERITVEEALATSPCFKQGRFQKGTAISEPSLPRAPRSGKPRPRRKDEPQPFLGAPSEGVLPGMGYRQAKGSRGKAAPTEGHLPPLSTKPPRMLER